MITLDNIRAIGPALRNNFSDCDDVISILEIALQSKKNVLLYGPGGHAKSMMVDTAMKALGVNAFVKSFSEGTTVDDIYGGLDIPAYQNGVLKHLTQNSFLNYEVAVFEELFDAPPATLCSLKDTLTAKCFRAGAEVVKDKCDTIIAITNVNPAEIEALGAAQAALVERFPLRVEVKWDSYTRGKYLHMLNKAYQGQMQHDTKDTVAFLASLTEGRVSPRTCCHLYESVIAKAALRGSNTPNMDDIMNVIKFFPELNDDNIKRKLEKLAEGRAGEQQFRALHKEIDNLVYNADRCKDQRNFIQAIGLIRRAKGKLTELEQIRQVPNDVYEELQSYKDSTKKLLQELQEAYLAGQYKA